MNKMHEKVSIWAKLYKRWEMMESDFRSTGAPGSDETGAGIRAMQMELRAMGAKADDTQDAYRRRSDY